MKLNKKKDQENTKKMGEEKGFVTVQNDGDIFIDLKTNLKDIFSKAINHKVFPGAAVAVSLGKGEKRKKFYGYYGNQTYTKNTQKIDRKTLFDLASLTKPLATTLSVLYLLKKKKLSFDNKVEEIMEIPFPLAKKAITLRHLLSHCSGLPAHREYYKKLQFCRKDKRKGIQTKYILKESLIKPPGKKEEYSDLGFMLLLECVEKATGERMERIVRKKIYGNKKIFFNPGPEERVNCAPTENCLWRKRILKGEVHDQNTSITGGVSGQAGLFGTVEDVHSLCSEILDQWKGEKEHVAYSTTDLKETLKRQNIIKKSTRALGFDTPAERNSSAGSFLSRKSAGHLGFTGTSFWIDPERDLVIVLLSNRIHPLASNNRIKEFRPLFHDSVVESLRMK